MKILFLSPLNKTNQKYVLGLLYLWLIMPGVLQVDFSSNLSTSGVHEILLILFKILSMTVYDNYKETYSEGPYLG